VSRLGSPALLGFTLEPGPGLCRGDMLAAVKRFQTSANLLVECGELDSANMVMLFQQPERFPDHLACGVVAARFNFRAHEFLKLVGKGDVHGLCF